MDSEKLASELVAIAKELSEDRISDREASQDVVKEFGQKIKQYNQLITRLDRSMKSLVKDFDGKNWGFVGSAGHVNEELEELVKFVGR